MKLNYFTSSEHADFAVNFSFFKYIYMIFVFWLLSYLGSYLCH